MMRIRLAKKKKKKKCQCQTQTRQGKTCEASNDSYDGETIVVVKAAGRHLGSLETCLERRVLGCLNRGVAVDSA
jgi:hypothetical protein